MMDDCGAVGGKSGKGTEVLGENLLQYHYVQQKCHVM
jgi:hypothetical protein